MELTKLSSKMASPDISSVRPIYKQLGSTWHTDHQDDRHGWEIIWYDWCTATCWDTMLNSVSFTPSWHLRAERRHWTGELVTIWIWSWMTCLSTYDCRLSCVHLVFDTGSRIGHHADQYIAERLEEPKLPRQVRCSERNMLFRTWGDAR